MKKEELLGKELSNLYAIAKQVNHYFDGSEINFLSERTQQILVNYIKFSCTNEEQTAGALRDLKINPGNTSDSIVNEITENLHDITTRKGYSKEIRELGFLMSLNRLIGYHESNLENIQYLMDLVYIKTKR
ncbi:hypothetical protein [Arenibacter certesii]|uniref:Uncharacterized protein n=1 Tax=Arenibacter certesii TaxID=228955 RepID=A0A918J526_9FLAO|nr:hypothetical protein [Arenibacter certesii]GGW47918.1 hypothetical protein GCM10007383_34970 [Arenibacter certesii]